MIHCCRLHQFVSYFVSFLDFNILFYYISLLVNLHVGFFSLARQCAQLWLKTREMLGFPLGLISEPDQIVLPKEVLEAACEKVSMHMWVS